MCLILELLVLDKNLFGEGNRILGMDGRKTFESHRRSPNSDNVKLSINNGYTRHTQL